MTKIELNGWIVDEGTDIESKLFFYSNKPVLGDSNEFCAGSDGDNVFDIELPIYDYLSVNDPQRCKITIELEK